MSSSNSNAAARRRRASPVVPPQPTSMAARVQPQPPQAVRNMPQGQPQPQPQRPGQQPQGQPQPGQPQLPIMTPAQMLIAHERRLTEIESMIPEIMKNASTYEMNDNENPEMYVDPSDIMSRVSELESRLSSMQTAFQLLHNFATETNTALLKFLNTQWQVSNENDIETDTTVLQVDNNEPQEV